QDRRRPALAALAAMVLAGCTLAAPPPPAPAPVESEFRVRDANLGNGITVRLEIPPAAAPPMPAVIAQIAERAELRAAGMIAVSYADWRPAPSPPPSTEAVGKLVLASPSAGVLGREYLRNVVRTATDTIPRVVDYLTTVPEIDPHRLGITGASTNG